MTLLSKYRNNQDGAAAIEFALAIPIVIMLFFGMAQFGLILLANSGIRHALDKAARTATVYVGATLITDQQIRNTVTANLYGIQSGAVSTPVVSRGVVDGVTYVDISVTYTTSIDFILYTYTPMSLTETRRAYLP